MVDKIQNSTKILDWQTLCPDHPVMDIGFLLCTSLNPENLDNWANDLIKKYVETFQQICLRFNIEKMPFDQEDFKVGRDFLTKYFIKNQFTRHQNSSALNHLKCKDFGNTFKSIIF